MNEATNYKLEVPSQIPNNPWVIHIPKSAAQLQSEGFTEDDIERIVWDWLFEVTGKLEQDGFPAAIARSRVCTCTEEEVKIAEERQEKEQERFRQLSKDLPSGPWCYTMDDTGLTKHPVDPDMWGYSNYLRELLTGFEYEPEEIQRVVEMFEEMYSYLGSYVFTMFGKLDIAKAKAMQDAYFRSMRKRFAP